VDHLERSAEDELIEIIAEAGCARSDTRIDRVRASQSSDVHVGPEGSEEDKKIRAED